MYTFDEGVRKAWPLAPILLCLIMCSCDPGEEQGPASDGTATDGAGRPLADLELPVALRTADAAPRGGAARLEITTEQLRLDGTALAPLQRGRVAAETTDNGTLPKLRAALAGKTMIALRLQANVAYDTLALVLHTARQAGIHEAALQVRKTGGSAETGWLSLSNFITSEKATDLPDFPGREQRSWDDFTARWTEVYEGCRTARTGNCAAVNANYARGGALRMELMTSGRGINVNFFRHGLTEAQLAGEERMRKAQMAAKKEDFLQGRITEEEMIEALLLGDPSTYALFQFRYQEALAAPSPIRATVAPLCESVRCAVVVVADPISPVMKVISLIGAAFPDGTRPPVLAFELPWTKRPPPADLAAFIAAQQEKGR